MNGRQLWLTALSIVLAAITAIYGLKFINSVSDPGTPTAHQSAASHQTSAFTPSTPAPNGPRDCSETAMLHCGAYTAKEFLDKVDNGDGVNSGEMLTRLYGQTAGLSIYRKHLYPEGMVFPDGRVEYKGKAVAINARIMNRQPGGQAPSITELVGSFWIHPVSEVLSAPMPAFVLVYQGGPDEFYLDAAIIMASGNVVDGDKLPKASSTSLAPPPQP